MVTCQVCQQEFSNLSSHINAKHQMNKTEYIAMFPGAKIVCEELSNSFSKRSESMHQRLKENDYEKYISIRKSTCQTMRNNKGIDFKHSDQTRVKMRESAKIRSAREPHTAETKKLISQSKTGIALILTKESKEEKTRKQKERWQQRKDSPEEYATYLQNLSEKRIAYIKQHGITLPKKGRKTNLEKRFIDFLVENQIEYKFQFLLEGKYYDFFLPILNLLVEVDGEYWHRMPKAIKNDLEKHIIAKSLGYKILRITETKWDTHLVFEEDYSRLTEHNHKIMNERTIQCQNHKVSISMF